MRHKYDTQGIVLSRLNTGEAHTLVTSLTADLGLVRARAQSVRKPGAKLASALTTLAESQLVLVRGREGWRVTGAVLAEPWFTRLATRSARVCAARVSGLLLRLVVGETQDAELFPILRGFFEALSTIPEDQYEAAEILAVVRILSVLGLDTGVIPGERGIYTADLIQIIQGERASYIARINIGIAASGL